MLFNNLKKDEDYYKKLNFVLPLECKIQMFVEKEAKAYPRAVSDLNPFRIKFEGEKIDILQSLRQ